MDTKRLLRYLYLFLFIFVTRVNVEIGTVKTIIRYSEIVFFSNSLLQSTF